VKAVLCHQNCTIADLQIEDVAPPIAGADDVLIAVKACGVNFYDGLAIAGKYQTRPEFPFSPGGEVAGVVHSVGDNVTSLRVGQRVLGFTGFGGYAEQVAVPAERVVPIPDDMPLETAAGFLIAYATAHHALDGRAKLGVDQTLLVLGASGGVGLAAVEVGKKLGARVIAAASTDEKLDLCRAHGADDLVNYSESNLKDAVRDLTGKRGVDVVFDPVGGDTALTALRTLSVFGQYLVIGFASGKIPDLAFNQLLLKQISLTGVLWGAFARANPIENAMNIATLMGWFSDGALRPHISARLPFDRFQDGLNDVMNGQARGKVVILPGQIGTGTPSEQLNEKAV